MVKNEGKPGQTIRKMELRMYEIEQGYDPLGMPAEVIRTHQGFLETVIRVLARLRIPYELHDVRPLGFPKPKLHLTHGFRFNQQTLLEVGLNKERSGLIGAPTRYGKTTLIVNTIRAFPGVKTILVAPGADLLLRNLKPDLQAALPHLDIKVLCSGSRDRYQSDDLTLVSMDSMHKCDHIGTRLILIDEPHALATEDRVEDFVMFENARKLGFGATLDGRFDGRDPLITGVIGPVLSSVTYREAVALGAISPIVVVMLQYTHGSFYARDRAMAYKQLLWQNPRVTQLLDVIGDPRYQVTMPGWQILGFISNEKQLLFLQEHMKTPFDFAMAKLMTTQERDTAMLKLKSGETKLCFATNMYAQGVTFSDLQVVINLAGGGASTQTIQKPGRVAEIRPGKRCGVLVDFEFLPALPQNNSPVDMNKDRSQCWQPARESAARRAYYEKIGFEVYSIQNSAQLQKIFQERCWPVAK